MPASDIDSIFASSKGKGKAKLASEPLPSPSAPAANSKTANQKKRKRIDAGRSEQQSAPKRKAAETVVDPSLRLSAKASAPATKPASDKLSKKRKKADEAEERFKDSRGTRPRRQTEEGFLIYKENELGITDQGGDTPLCPFDCDCCF